MYSGTKILFPAFVFSLTELANPQNSWGQGLNNVYIARYRQSKIRGREQLIEILDDELLCFPMQKKKKKNPSGLIVPPRCYHQNVWCGLFQLRKGIMKILNKQSGQSKDQEVDSVSIGNIPLETFNYLHVVGNSGTERLSCRMFSSSETYLDLGSNLTRRKIRMSFHSGILRFETMQDLDILRHLLGIASVYGSSEHRPTLADGKHGRPLKRGHFLTVVKGKEKDDVEDHTFKRRSMSQRVDLCFSPYQVKVTVGFERYRYDHDHKGRLKSTPPTRHLQAVLACSAYEPEAELDSCSVSDESSESNESEHHRKEKAEDDKSVSTFDRILNGSLDSSEDSTPSNSSKKKKTEDNSDDELSLHSHSDNVRFRFGDVDIYQGDQFHLDGTVYEIVGLFLPSDQVRFVIQEQFSTELYTSSKPATSEKELSDKSLARVGTIAPSEQPTYGCIVCGGHRLNKKTPLTEQEIALFQHTDTLLSAIKEYN